MALQPNCGLWPPRYMRFLDHTQRRATVGRTPLDEWSARRRLKAGWVSESSRRLQEQKTLSYLAETECCFVSRLTRVSSSSSSSFFFFFFFCLWGRRNPTYALQPTEAYCANPACLFPRSSPEPLHVRRLDRTLSAKGGSMGKNGRSNVA
jgi:hypothetical protein